MFAAFFPSVLVLCCAPFVLETASWMPLKSIMLHWLKLINRSSLPCAIGHQDGFGRVGSQSVISALYVPHDVYTVRPCLCPKGVPSACEVADCEVMLVAIRCNCLVALLAALRKVIYDVWLYRGDCEVVYVWACGWELAVAGAVLGSWSWAFFATSFGKTPPGCQQSSFCGIPTSAVEDLIRLTFCKL